VKLFEQKRTEDGQVGKQSNRSPCFLFLTSLTVVVLGAKLSIFVYLGESPDSAFLQIEDNFPVAELKNRIKAVLAKALDKWAAGHLVVRTKDADNKLHLLDKAKLALADALKCNSGGEYEVYVEEVAAGSLVQLRWLHIWSRSCDAPGFSQPRPRSSRKAID